MNFEYSDKVKDLIARLEAFMDEHIYPNEKAYHEWFDTAENPWSEPPLMAELKVKARDAGLWNLFLPNRDHGAGLTNLEYAPLCEIMGRAAWCSEAFNCSAPDTGNMEVLAEYGNKEQQAQWLDDLLEGKKRSAFAMTEPEVASSDATNIETSIRRDGDEYVINGRKWYISGAMHENCEIMIVMGKTDPDNPHRHLQQSQVLVPLSTPGVKIVRPMRANGYLDQPAGHAEILFEDVRVPVSNILLGEGRGFEIAQGRLGPGRIHHCMRLIGCAQRALEMTCERVNNRTTFGKKLIQHQSVREDIAKSFCDIEQARLLTLKAADTMDKHGNKVAQELIAAIKIIAPSMAADVIDRAIQIHGAMGVSQDTPFSEMYAYARICRLADGPDQVHMMQLGRNLAKKFA